MLPVRSLSNRVYSIYVALWVLKNNNDIKELMLVMHLFFQLGYVYRK